MGKLNFVETEFLPPRKRPLPIMRDEDHERQRARFIALGLITPSQEVYPEGVRPCLTRASVVALRAKLIQHGLITPRYAFGR